MPSERSIASASRYIAAATRCRQSWDDAFARSDDGHRLSARELLEMHGAGLGLMWTTHSTDLSSALGLLHQVENGTAAEPSAGPDDPRSPWDQARRVLESRRR
jgi:hypothetical protein